MPLEHSSLGTRVPVCPIHIFSPKTLATSFKPHAACPGMQDFRKIATHLRGRSTGDCIKYYYRNQKLDEFAAVRRKQQLKKRRMQSSEKGRQYMGGRVVQAKNAAPVQGEELPGVQRRGFSRVAV